ncbi:MAG: universal stress protein UspA [Cellvibrionaceae bacterium]|nr:universal stress protein UspA [Cellvibrionaceae bacterium]|tara:strand:+ start:22259 stop:22681 length:423 start_codon:yes stop_codon:yes gene_type:complete
MNRYNSILCAVDLTDNTYTVLRAALELTDIENIRLLHVCEHPITGYGEATGGNHQVTESQIRQKVFPELKDLLTETGIDSGQLQIRFGGLADQIASYAIEVGSDLIMVGSHEKHGLRALLGSTSGQVVKTSPCDVLAVRV